MAESATGTFEDGINSGASRRGCGRLSRNPWSAWEIGAMVGGFVVFWPIGLLALFVKWKNGEMWKGSSEGNAPWNAIQFKKQQFEGWKSSASSWRAGNFGGGFGTGNAAFDDYKREALRKLDEERRRLDEEQRMFRDFVDKLRRAKDQDEFERFMAERRQVIDPSNT
ncbi:DUF2852 domain-containing protein [Aestuariivirga sp.]|uniref:DUF2852 domain-containing protein n=1 Tax=Aestuariivirga sp. TaxID=2650926 RepID=UPI0039E3B903